MITSPMVDRLIRVTNGTWEAAWQALAVDAEWRPVLAQLQTAGVDIVTMARDFRRYAGHPADASWRPQMLTKYNALLPAKPTVAPSTATAPAAPRPTVVSTPPPVTASGGAAGTLQTVLTGVQNVVNAVRTPSTTGGTASTAATIGGAAVSLYDSIFGGTQTAALPGSFVPQQPVSVFNPPAPTTSETSNGTILLVAAVAAVLIAFAD